MSINSILDGLRDRLAVIQDEMWKFYLEVDLLR